MPPRVRDIPDNYVFPSQGQKRKERKEKRKKGRKIVFWVFWYLAPPESGFSPVGSLAKGRKAYDLISKWYLTYFTLEFKKRGNAFLVLEVLGKVPYGRNRLTG